MTAYRMRPLGRKRQRFAECQPNLFTWAQERSCADPADMARAARLLARRFSLSPHHARAVAELAGYSMETSP